MGSQDLKRLCLLLAEFFTILKKTWSVIIYAADVMATVDVFSCKSASSS